MSSLNDTDAIEEAISLLASCVNDPIYSEESPGHYMILGWRRASGERIWSLTFADHVSEEGRWAALGRVGLSPAVQVEIIRSYDSNSLGLPEWEDEETVIIREAM